jgi:putative lipoprotein
VTPLRRPSLRGIVRAAMKPKSPMKSLSVTLASALAVVMVPGCATVEPTPAPAPAAGKAEPAVKVIRGSIVYREKVALPSDAELVVQLLDVTKPDKPVVNAEAKIRTDGGQVPIRFALPLDPAKLTGSVHSMRASIRFGGKTQFVTGARVIIDPSSPPQALVMTVVAGDTERAVDDSPAPGGGRGPPPRTIPPRGPAPPRR